MRKLAIIVIACVLIIHLKFISGKAITTQKAGLTTTPSPSDEEDGKTAPPWLKFLKSKKTTTLPPQPPTIKSGSTSDIKSSNSARAIDPSVLIAPQQSEMDQLAQWLGIYPSGSILAQDRAQNPTSLYDEMYLDWMKRDVESTDNNLEMQTADAPQTQQPQPILNNYPAVPLTYGYGYPPFYPYLAGMKMQKAMAQAQVDAAMAALDITTTPKPLKLKLKIQVPGNINMTQLGLITAGLANSLPPGSTYELA